MHITRLGIITLISSFLISACGGLSPSVSQTSAPTPTVSSTTIVANTVNAYYVDESLGSDSNPGTKTQPWQTMVKALRSLETGDTLYMRGTFYTSWQGGYFANSGTPDFPITVTNYPGEQVEIRTDVPAGIERAAFMCWNDANSRTPKADYIRIVGTDVNGEKGIVIRGMVETKVPGIWLAGDCEHWEIAGLHIRDMGKGIFLKKFSDQTIYSYSPDHHYIHDNLIENYYSGEGIQVNGNYNLVENNQIYKVTDVINTDWSCHHINVLGHHNIIRGNDLQAMGSTAGCVGILFEWDIADFNLVENNVIAAYGWGAQGYVVIAGGDNNVIRDNVITGTAQSWYHIYSGTTYWPCNELTDAKSIVPANDPTAPDYEYFYSPRNCFSENNQVHDNIYNRTP